MSCASGRFQGTSGRQSCDECEAGKFQGEEGATSCDTCELGFDSIPGSASCDRCTRGYYWVSSDERCAACPDGAKCHGDLFLPAPTAGHWADRSKIEYAESIYSCLFETCAGVDPADECLRIPNFENASCDWDKQQCSTGASGPLCGCAGLCSCV